MSLMWMYNKTSDKRQPSTYTALPFIINEGEQTIE